MHSSFKKSLARKFMMNSPKLKMSVHIILYRKQKKEKEKEEGKKRKENSPQYTKKPTKAYLRTSSSALSSLFPRSRNTMLSSGTAS